MRERLDWSELNRSGPGWDPTEWRRPIDSLEELQQGEHEGLVAVAPAALKFPEQLHWVFGPYEVGLRSEEHTSELQSRPHLVCRLLLEKKKMITPRVTVQLFPRNAICPPNRSTSPTKMSRSHVPRSRASPSISICAPSH